MEEREINVDLKLDKTEDLERMNETLRDTINQLGVHNRNLKHIIVTMIVCFTLIICTGVGGFFWYESQFEVLPETEETITEMITDGDNANINNVEGNQYNDEATHNEEVK